MNSILGLLLAIILAFILIVLFYNYMNLVRDTYIHFDNDTIKELPWYIPPRWVRDAWDPTWLSLQRIFIQIQT